MVTVIAKATHQILCAKAVIDGLKVVGKPATLQMSSAVVKTHDVACWGWRIGAPLRAAGHNVLVMERGYLGDRFNWYSLGWNGLNGYADFPYQVDDGERFRSHFTMKPWKKGGEYTLIIGQVPGDMSLQGRDLLPWYKMMAWQAQTYGLPVKFRPHPLAWVAPRDYPAVELLTGSLEESLDGAAFCITWNSNTAVDAVLAGVPTITTDRGSMAWGVTGHHIGERLTPDREEWAAKLAWCQWQLPEISKGIPFEMAYA